MMQIVYQGPDGKHTVSQHIFGSILNLEISNGDAYHLQEVPLRVDLVFPTTAKVKLKIGGGGMVRMVGKFQKLELELTGDVSFDASGAQIALQQITATRTDFYKKARGSCVLNGVFVF